MKILKYIGLTIVGLIVFLLLVALFIPNQYTVTVKKTIRLPKVQVYDYVSKLANQEFYSEWVLADPDLHPKIEGVDGTVGAKQIWNSKLDEVGEGEQIITSIDENKIDVDLIFKRPFEGRAKSSTVLKSISDQETEVSFIFYGDEPYPMNLPFYLFGQKMIEKTETKNLENLKTILEQSPQ